MTNQDKFVQVDGLKTRYIEEGSGPDVIDQFYQLSTKFLVK
jgi:hypothetical protein